MPTRPAPQARTPPLATHIPPFKVGGMVIWGSGEAGILSQAFTSHDPYTPRESPFSTSSLDLSKL